MWGDVHFYDYLSDAFAPQTYPAAKFISEFGYQACGTFKLSTMQYFSP